MVTISDLQFGYNKKPIFSHFNFQVPPGQICLVTGINGVGKSTLLRLIAGVLKPQQGQITYDSRLGASPRNKIGFISDSLSIYESLRVNRLIDLHLSVFNVKQFDDTLIRHTRISSRDKVRDLSKGQRTILHLSLILSTQPELLLIDEVIHDLDAYLRKLFLDEVIRHLTEREVTVIFVNVNFHDIESMVDRVVLLKDGAIAVDESIDILKEKVKRVLLTGDLPAGVPYIFSVPRDNFTEYFVYPYDEKMGKNLPVEATSLNLNDIVAAFIGGEYV
jgi:ABC-2 type transport system ATP-binding protein